MNLMKLFKKINLKYLKENIKKSKGLLAFCLGLIPLINILVLFITTISLNKIEVLDFNSISIITYLGLFIIPIVLAVSLFGFVFKNKSVDFVLSKPLSRSTIYITNIIGGILIITMFMLLNSLIYALFGLLFSSLIIPFGLIIDYFILFLISYIFMFIVASLGVCIAGNLMGSLVLVIIILCLSPFLKVLDIYYKETNPTNIYIKCDNEECKPENYSCSKYNNCINHLQNKEYEIDGGLIHKIISTAPFYSLDDIDGTFKFYNTKSIIKMIILIPIYSIIGYYLFNKRKMESNETSFKNTKLHYIVKIITLIPVSFLCYLIIKESIELGFIIDIFIVLIYSIIYDLITRKEIYKLLKSSMISLIALSIFLGIYVLYDIYLNNNNTVIVKNIEVITIDKITIKKDKTYNVFSKTIKGEEIINRLIKETLDKKTEFKGRKFLTVKTKNKNYNIEFSIQKETEEIIKEIIRLENIAYLQNYDYDSIDSVSSNIRVTKDLKELIKKTMTNVDEYTYENNYLLEVLTYKNHEYKSIYIMPGLSKELDKYILNEKNKQTINFLENNNNIEFSANDDYRLFDYVLSKNKTKFISYLKNSNNIVTDNTLIIYACGLTILIGDKTSFESEYAKYEESLANDEYYQNLLKSYDTDTNTFEDNVEEKEDYEY